MKEWGKIQNLLDIYEDASGQGINKSKIEIFFSTNTGLDLRKRILRLPRVASCSNQEQYLGLPMMVCSNKYCTFKVIKDKVWNRVNN